MPNVRFLPVHTAKINSAGNTHDIRKSDVALTCITVDKWLDPKTASVNGINTIISSTESTMPAHSLSQKPTYSSSVKSSILSKKAASVLMVYVSNRRFCHSITRAAKAPDSFIIEPASCFPMPIRDGQRLAPTRRFDIKIGERYEQDPSCAPSAMHCVTCIRRTR